MACAAWAGRQPPVVAASDVASDVASSLRRWKLLTIGRRAAGEEDEQTTREQARRLRRLLPGILAN